MSEKDEKIEELTAQIHELSLLNTRQGERINALISEMKIVTDQMRAIENRLVLTVIEEAEDNDYCLDGQMEFVAKVLNKRVDDIRHHFIESYTITIDFTGPVGLDKYLDNLNSHETQEFIETYIDNSNIDIDVNHVSFG